MKKIELSQVADRYINEVLAYDSALCSRFRKQIKSKKKSFFTMLPYSAVTKNIYSFSDGGVLPKKKSFVKNKLYINEVNDTTDWLASYLYKKITEGSCICMFDDVMASSDDLAGFETTACIINGDVVHIVDNENVKSEEYLKRLVFACKVSWHFVCLIAKTNEPYLDSRSKTHKRELDNMADHLCEVIVGAYDGEAYIVASL